MGLICYECKTCKRKQFAFDGETDRIDWECKSKWCEIVVLPPNPTTVHATNTYMSEPQLDTLSTIYELDRILNIEAREEKELKILNEYRKNI
jgi:hypothetical protein